MQGRTNPSLTVRELLAHQELRLELLAGEPGLDHRIGVPRIQTNN
jgi:serine kinase of HPr protein (carbohydrate metabolism regulator)